MAPGRGARCRSRPWSRAARAGTARASRSRRRSSRPESARPRTSQAARSAPPAREARSRRRTRARGTRRPCAGGFRGDMLIPLPLTGEEKHMLSFGVTALPDPPYTRLVEVFQNGERNGFEYGWTYDSHILWQDSYATLPIAAVQTESIKLGHCVTNPGIRDPTITASWYATLHDVSNGRAVMGIGRGDSSRRVVGLKPVKVDEFERRLVMIKELMNGRAVDWNGKDLCLEWVREEVPDVPMHVAGYGPRALGVAGRVGDGVIIQLADPQIIRWIIETARKAAEEAGRDPAALQCIVCAPSHVTDDLADAREQVRWFPAMVSNHVMDLIERYGEDSDEIPSALTDFVKARKFYDYKDHSRVGAAHGEFVTDEICDRFCVLGNSEQIAEKLRELESIGVDQFDIYLMTKGQDETLATYGEEIIPKFTKVAA